MRVVLSPAVSSWLADVFRPDQNSRRELILLSLAAVFVGLSHLTLALVRPGQYPNAWPYLWWLMAAGALHLTATRTVPQRDPFILPVIMLLTGWGLALIARLAPPFLQRQTTWLIVATGAAIIVLLLPPNFRWLRRYRYTWLMLGLFLLAATLFFGVNPSGQESAPRLWLDFGIVFVQPSELLRLLLIVFLASYLAEKHDRLASGLRILRWRLPSLAYLAPMALMWAVCTLLLVLQRDLGMASLFFVVFLSMLYIATGQFAYLLSGAALLIVSAIAGYFLYGVIRLRIDTWWNPWPEADNRAFQIVQSLIAVANGGIIGQGIGLGSPIFVPVVHSDFVFAAVAEEFGLFGGIGVLAAFAILVFRAFRIAMRNVQQRFRSLLAAAIGVSFGTQSLLIMAGVLKIIPLTGVALPFMSYGGSSLLISFVMVALLLKLSAPAIARRSLLRLPTASRSAS